jgi:uncharacterized protein (DUF427 family)
MKATWQGTTLAESDDTVEVEGNHYFPPDSIRSEHFRESDQHTHCPWKGRRVTTTSLWTGKRIRARPGITPEPKEAGANIKGRIAF